MAILNPTLLETLATGVQNWTAILTANAQKLNTYLGRLWPMVDGSTPTAGQVPVYDADADQWVPGTVQTTTSWNNLSDKPQEFPPAAHTHAADDIVGWAAIRQDIAAQVYRDMLGPALDWDAADFIAEANGAPPIATVVRASAATRVNEVGQIKSVGANVLRHDYDPETGKYLGWLIEERRTNLFSHSSDFDNAAWTKTCATVVPNSTQAPDGTVSADFLREDSTADSVHMLSRWLTPTAGTAYTSSYFVRVGGRDHVRLQLGGAGTSSEIVVFDLATGEVLSDTGTSGKIKNYGFGWYRICVSLTAVTAETLYSYLLLHDGTSHAYTGDGVSGVYVWGAQPEDGPFWTSYIPTADAQATRAADVFSADVAGFDYNMPAGCLFVDFTLYGIPGGFPAIVSFWEGINDRLPIFVNTGSGQLLCQCRNEGTASASLAVADIATGVRYRVAFSWAVDNFAACANAGDVLTDNTGTVPDGVTRLDIGNYNQSSILFDGHVRRLSYFPTALTSANVKTLTK